MMVAIRLVVIRLPGADPEEPLVFRDMKRPVQRQARTCARTWRLRTGNRVTL